MKRAIYLKREFTYLYLWLFTGAVFAIVKLSIGKYNNYKIFKWVYWHSINGQSLYGNYPEYYDSNHYGPLFSAVIAPFAILPDWLGMVLWVMLNTALLFYAIRELSFTRSQKIFVYLYAYCELMTAQGVQQFNISVAAFIILSFALIEKKKEFWATCIILLSALIKIYPIVGLAFFFFFRRKLHFIFYCFFWGIIFLILPVLYTPGYEYVVSQYGAWWEQLEIKNELNKFALSQNVSLLGLVRKLSGNPDYKDVWLILPAMVLFFIPYLRIDQYKYLNFRLMFLSNVLLFVVLFSTGTEASGYITAMIGVAIWYICSSLSWKNIKLFFFGLL
ncbi:MAG: DUF2029 domain-containing protein [Tannerellaceae bacterium]|nr:DUF2029 domain-containing protein [Tannerellaceae bacterium]